MVYFSLTTYEVWQFKNETGYSSSSPWPFSSCAVFAFTSSTDGKLVPFTTLFTLGYKKQGTGCQISEYWGCSSIGMPLLGRNFLIERALWVGALSWSSIQTFFQRFGRFFRKICCTQTSILANNFTDFLNILVGFQCQRVTWTLIIFHCLPTLTKSFVPLKHTWNWH